MSSYVEYAILSWGRLSSKKENMMLFSKQTVWCPTCKAERPQVREAKGRTAAIEEERKGYPEAVTTKTEESP